MGILPDWLYVPATYNPPPSLDSVQLGKKPAGLDTVIITKTEEIEDGTDTNI